MLEIVKEIQTNDYTHFNGLLERFQPLILSWLHKINAYSNDKEDYISHAKIILLESAKNYDFKKHVPFQSYYKINLYHWYGNYMNKKKWPTAYYEETIDESTEIDFDSELIREEELITIQQFSEHLTEHEKIILDGLLNNLSTKEIAEQIGLSKKTVLNKKYMMIKKIKEQVSHDLTDCSF